MIDSFRGPFRFLSNFYVCDDGWCLEHVFQSLKADSEVERAWVMASPDATTAKHRGYKVRMRPDWEERKVDVMRRLLRLKFKRPELAEALLATGNVELIEGNNWGDVFWGRCEGAGKNWLGVLLMDLRHELQVKKNQSNSGEVTNE